MSVLNGMANAIQREALCSASFGSSSAMSISSSSCPSPARGRGSPLSTSPPSSSGSFLHAHAQRRTQPSSVATQATKEFVGVVVRNRSKPRGRRGCGGDDGDEDDYFEDDGSFGSGGLDGFNWGGDQGGNGNSGGFNWGNYGGGSGGGNSWGGWDSNGGYSEHNPLFCMAMFHSIWFWQLACLGSCAQAARFMLVCLAAARTEQAAANNLR